MKLIFNNVDIKERDRLIKELEEKLETKEAEIKEAKTKHEKYLSESSLNTDAI